MKKVFIIIGRLSHRTKVIGGVLAVLAVSGSGYLAFASSGGLETPPMLVEAGADTLEVSAIHTVQPVLLSNSSSTILIGTVLSHETANIYSRRDGIVEDVLVDIGDKVRKDQVVALLLPQGVEGQSAAMIGEKNAMKSQAEAEFRKSQVVADETLISARQEIQEMETELLVTQREQQALLNEFADKEADIRQMTEQAFTTVRMAKQVTEQILTGTNSRPGVDIQERHMMDQLGLLNRQERYDMEPLFIQLSRAEKEFLSVKDTKKREALEELLLLTDRVLSRAVSLLSATPSVPTEQTGFYTQEELADLITMVLSAQEDILEMKEKLQDAVIAFDMLIASEPDVYRAYRTGKTDGIKSNEVRMKESELLTMRNKYFVEEADQSMTVEQYKQMVGVADAQLRLQYAESGHRQIRSPFSGTVSKRFVTVGQIVMPSMPAFELTDVPTTLAKKAKREIQFGLPEILRSAVSLGDMVVFFLPEEEEEAYQAEVTRISPQVDTETHTVTVQAKLDDSLKLPHNTSVRIRIVDRSTPLFRVPSYAVKREGDMNFVWLMHPETLLPEKVRVTVRSEEGEFAEVTGNISEESKIILDPPDFLALPPVAEPTDDSQQEL
ncbi:hypothetical protein A2424_03640 [Candidatus Peribacteria bacterium RIFOXYC1_FULL_54_13]|nr:MAG: hypothetical protein A2198_06105 [Candidatus Peribacteria bacterium RIFOXYA1_FULL_56_14]OGJ74310.1 MAG: hypothetical protein A2384_06300 [Candidatus Peribacteria bacterium RIFOXYB1_FULL_54_35]OGJ75155.1 MAG: hypothetical protein A2217_05500 [Candidatus Peribacteria bacterium RIFOXYA2_FULL_55_28]OGJ75928.1 MAG: hypothetical protein A2327_03445 [Candidatus Peribacteria bacterium RIFOXYB2_FULL_54_17]OGJ77419.1 MAG: hypothetical protein A2424_03640 [Candidatus Peribacteria bacterium RIFOXYC